MHEYPPINFFIYVFRLSIQYIHSCLTYINMYFSPRFSPMSDNLDSVISRFIYINVYNRNRQVDISETEVYITNSLAHIQFFTVRQRK